MESDPTAKLDLAGKEFMFSRLSGRAIGRIRLNENGSIGDSPGPKLSGWHVEDGQLYVSNAGGEIILRFSPVSENGGLMLVGDDLRGDFKNRPVLSEIRIAGAGSVRQDILNQLYCGVSPYESVKPGFMDDGYPHTHLDETVANLILEIVKPTFWLEVGSMVGGSAIQTAQAIRKRKSGTQIVCADPFCGDVNMWAWERELKLSGEWQFLRIEDGRPTIWERFLANVLKAGVDDIIVPITATSIVGIRLLQRLYDEYRLSELPQVIYLDSAHEADETFLELKRAWSILPEGGILFGDDWGWQAVRQDVLKFSLTITQNSKTREALQEGFSEFQDIEGVLISRGHWILTK